MLDLDEAAQQAASSLLGTNRRVVFAESCTAGLVSASLAQVAGISAHHCGSAVTYRNDTKHCWLGVQQSTLDEHTAVSAPVAEQMALGALIRTPEASLSLSITGHLGPQAPEGYDGLVFIGVAIRPEGGMTEAGGLEVQPAMRVKLDAPERSSRQQEAAARVLLRLAEL